MTTSLSAAGPRRLLSRPPPAPSRAPQEVAVPAGAEPFLDLLGDLALGQIHCQLAGRRDALGRGRAVRDHHRALHAEPVSAARICSVTKAAAPSRVFSATLPVKPSVTMTSALADSRSPPSTLPTKRSGWPTCGDVLASSSWARRASRSPFPGAAPMVSRPTLGSAMPYATCA